MGLMEKIIKRRNPNPFQTLTREDLVRNGRKGGLANLGKTKRTRKYLNVSERKRA
jgi:hypothetical protein